MTRFATALTAALAFTVATAVTATPARRAPVVFAELARDIEAPAAIAAVASPRLVTSELASFDDDVIGH
jgi:hypothetical protein